MTRFEDVAAQVTESSVSIAVETCSSITSEAVKRAQEQAAPMGFAPTETAVAHKPTKAHVHVLRLDALGREIDEHGHVVSVTKPSSIITLKVNINKQKKDAFRILKPQLEVDPQENLHHYDQRIGIEKNKILRPKRMSFKVKQGHPKKAKDDDMNPDLTESSESVARKEKLKEQIPDVEWWDAEILTNDTITDLLSDPNILINDTINESHLKIKKIIGNVEHQFPLEPLAESASPPPQLLKLTKKEQKKLRRLRRVAKEKEKQKMIRLGLLEPPKPKVKLSNLMKVLASEATQDPTKLEKEIRTAAAEREQAHRDRNTARKLTPAEKREKKKRKLYGDPTTVETIVSVYKINKKLSHPETRFKVEMNARQNILTGCSVMTDGFSVVVVEGNSKSIKTYKKLMLKRINWEKTEKKEEEEEEENGGNKCRLIWQGSVEKPSFHKFNVQECSFESAAKKVFTDAGVPHYWSLALNYSDD
ncbi:hypothetical protein CARUB_v10019184mg [Capsella rubella]|uniref:Uncharacterized protein n=1 Tax=Capsella rubella TaxID=81985 RepID=R0FTK7_9BRAS|nr:protein RDM16 [Capsella rubella]EOA25816.1 hypothetical protein CARUB_v10019184mg [Capsella rubella]